MSPWNETTERKLLLCIIDHAVKPEWPKISEAMGEDFTGEACRCVILSSLPYIFTCFPFLGRCFLTLPSLYFSLRLSCAQLQPHHFLNPSHITLSKRPCPHSKSYLSFHLIVAIMVFKWDSESERQLLVLVISEMSPPGSSIWPSVADKLGRGLNGNACRYYRTFTLLTDIASISIFALLLRAWHTANTMYSQKFYKLKRESEKRLGTGGAANGTDPKTPTKAKANAKTTPGTGKSGGKRKKPSDSTDDATTDAPTPTKKTKAAVKAEPEPEEEDKKVKPEKTDDEAE